jgi:hypothetical protein
MTGKKRATTTRRDRPETLRQARTWETVKGHYEAAGLCEGCAGQAAYGAQLGFAKINPPCDHCSYVVLPLELIARHGIRGQQWLHGHFTKRAGDVPNE